MIPLEQQSIVSFRNRAGDHPDTDEIATEELHTAGILTMDEVNVMNGGRPMGHNVKMVMRKQSGEVKTSVRGFLHGWVFTRGWYYWVAEGPGIEVEAAEKLHAVYGGCIRVDGHAGCPSPREHFKGLACGKYHVDTPKGLKALADTIKEIVAKSEMK